MAELNFSLPEDARNGGTGLPMSRLFFVGVVVLFLFIHAAQSRAGEFLDEITENEPERMEKYSFFVKRKGETLRLKLKSGSYKTLKDKSKCDTSEECIHHRFVDYFRDKGFYVLYVGYLEGDSYLMISDKTGKDFIIPEMPEVSPDRKRFVSASADEAYGINGVFVWRFEGDEMVNELAYEPFEPPIKEYALYEFKGWKDNETVILDKLMHANSDFCPDAILMTIPVTLRKEDGGWRFYETLSTETARCGSE